jgi:hypothetical protein
MRSGKNAVASEQAGAALHGSHGGGLPWPMADGEADAFRPCRGLDPRGRVVGRQGAGGIANRALSGIWARRWVRPTTRRSIMSGFAARTHLNSPTDGKYLEPGDSSRYLATARAGRAHAQPEEHRPRHPQAPAGGDHRAVGVGQVQPGVRHAVRRGPAPLCGKPERLRAAVPAADGQARCGRDRGPVARPSASSRRPPATTRAPPWARSPRSTTTCACCTPAPARPTAPTTTCRCRRRA